MNIDDLLNDREKLFKILNNENELGLVLISVNFLEQWLVLLLEKKFIDDPKEVAGLFDINGLLIDFSKKVKFSYCLGIIDKVVMKDLKEIAKIRNKFAHSHQLLTFENKAI
jgi:DNA-binding MltR family transcriptional regulator